MALVLAVSVVAACGDDGSDEARFEVRSDVVSDETTQDIRVFAPDAEGSWPVVFALHGIDGSAEQMDALGQRLARAGMVVFAPSYRSDLSSDQGQLELVRDVECGYRFARSIASEYGGDLEQPVTFLGWSLGATFAIQGGLQEEIDPSGQYLSCAGEVPRADVIVAVSGCHYDVPRNLFDASQWGNQDAKVTVVDGDEDTTCPASQSEDAATQLRSGGYDVELVTLEGADHFAPVFAEFVGGEMVPAPDSPAGDKVVQIVLDAVAAGQAED